MKVQRATATRNRAGQFLPQVEALERRWCPSAASITVQGHTMIIKGDALADQITIRDDGVAPPAWRATPASTKATTVAPRSDPIRL